MDNSHPVEAKQPSGSAAGILQSAAGVAVIGAAGLYLLGWVRLSRLLKSFGIEGLFASDPYAVMAMGGEGSSLSLLILAVLISPGFLFSFVISRSRRGTRLLHSPFAEFVSYNLRSFWVTLAFMYALLAVIATGEVFGRYEAFIAHRSVERACSRCFHYELRKGYIHGFPLIGDKDKLALLLPSKRVFVIRWDQVRWVGPAKTHSSRRRGLASKAQPRPRSIDRNAVPILIAVLLPPCAAPLTAAA